MHTDSTLLLQAQGSLGSKNAGLEILCLSLSPGPLILQRMHLLLEFLPPLRICFLLGCEQC